MRNRYILKESELHNIIKECVRETLNEMYDTYQQVASYIFNPYELCETDDEIEILKQNNIADEYKLTFGRLFISEPMTMNTPAYDDTEDFEMDDDSGLLKDIAVLKDFEPELYSRIREELETIDEDDLEWHGKYGWY